MKRNILTAIFVVISTFAIADEELVENGDFSKGSSRWDGDENVEYETSAEQNKVCKIEVDDDGDLEFHQKFSVDDYKDLFLTFKIRKSEDYEGRGYQVRFIRKDGSYTYMERKLPKNNDWKEMEIKFSDIKRSSHIELRFIVRSGESGYLAFDDISVIGK